MVLGLLIPLAPTFIRGESVEPFLLVFLVVPLLLAVLVGRFGAWAWVLGAIVGTLLLLALLAFGAAFALGHPEAFLDFVPAT
jgi:hypothetical protein